jgi:hypothetical protein
VTSETKIRALLVAFLVSIIFGITVTAFAFHQANTSSRNALAASIQAKAAAVEAHRGLCGLKAGYVKQLRDTQRLIKHPIPGLDIPKPVLENALIGLRARVKSVEDVKCP